MVWVRRALLGLTMAAVAGGSGWAWAVSAPAETSAAAKKHVAAKGSKAQAKSSGVVRRAPAASFAKKPVKGKKGKAGAASHAQAAGRGGTRTSAGVVQADLERPPGGREATMARITEELASTKVGIEYPRALRPFFDQLIQLEADPKASLVRVIQFGDSHTAADLFTGALRQLFQTKFGDGGAGFQVAGYPFAGYRSHGTQRAQTTG